MSAGIPERETIEREGWDTPAAEYLRGEVARLEAESKRPYVVFFGFRLAEIHNKLQSTSTRVHVVGADVVMRAPGGARVSIEDVGPSAWSLRPDKTYTLKLIEEDDAL